MKLGLLLLGGAALLAAETPLPELRIETREGRCAVFLRNNYPEPLTAFQIELRGSPQPAYTSVDQYASGGIAPGAERRLSVADPDACATPGRVRVYGAVYADGSVAGDAEPLLATRKATLLSLREGLRRIEAGRGLPKAKLIAEIEAWKQVVLSIPHPTDRAARGMSGLGAQYVLGAVKRNSDTAQAIEQIRRMERELAATRPPLD